MGIICFKFNIEFLKLLCGQAQNINMKGIINKTCRNIVEEALRKIRQQMSAQKETVDFFRTALTGNSFCAPLGYSNTCSVCQLYLAL